MVKDNPSRQYAQTPWTRSRSILAGSGTKGAKNQRPSTGRSQWSCGCMCILTRLRAFSWLLTFTSYYKSHRYSIDNIEAIDTIDAFPIDAFKNVCLVKYDKNVTILLSHSVLTAGSIDRRSLCDVFFLFKKSIYKKYLPENTLASY